jgi:hypothetical protein
MLGAAGPPRQGPCEPLPGCYPRLVRDPLVDPDAPSPFVSRQDEPPHWDPYLVRRAPPATPRWSALAVAALVVALLGPLSVLGPLGALFGIALGVVAYHTLGRQPDARGRGVASAAIVLGVIGLAGWVGVGAWAVRAHLAELAAAPAAPPFEAGDDAPRGPLVPVPLDTRETQVGDITVVDVGTSTPSLEAELLRQALAASRDGETLMVMTTTGACEPCRGVGASLADTRMQEALGKVRLVRVDIPTFFEDLDDLDMFSDRYPGYFLMGADARPHDGIDGGEWGEDIAENIAPVLGPFVRGKLTRRRTTWSPPQHGQRL